MPKLTRYSCHILIGTNNIYTNNNDIIIFVTTCKNTSPRKTTDDNSLVTIIISPPTAFTDKLYLCIVYIMKQVLLSNMYKSYLNNRSFNLHQNNM